NTPYDLLQTMKDIANYYDFKILAGLLNVDESLYEAAAIDGVKNRFQEMIYVTIPSMKPQMLFAAVMQIVGAFQNGTIATMLAGNPTPGYSAQLIVNHIEDYGFIRYEMGYAAAVSVILLLIVQIFSSVSTKLFGEKDLGKEVPKWHIKDTE
ncbi:MAG: sugar ABC transporter permease, partial [Lachnospiraceae bacterium]|nr:sugar ABC transporter permease [Lachnospiraceae bacterium]